MDITIILLVVTAIILFWSTLKILRNFTNKKIAHLVIGSHMSDLKELSTMSAEDQELYNKAAKDLSL